MGRPAPQGKEGPRFQQWIPPFPGPSFDGFSRRARSSARSRIFFAAPCEAAADGGANPRIRRAYARRPGIRPLNTSGCTKKDRSQRTCSVPHHRLLTAALPPLQPQLHWYSRKLGRLSQGDLSKKVNLFSIPIPALRMIHPTAPAAIWGPALAPGGRGGVRSPRGAGAPPATRAAGRPPLRIVIPSSP